MAYERLLQQRLIRPYRAKPEEVERLLQVAARDLSTASKILPDDADWAFNIVYNAVLQAARALVLHEGFRPRGAGQHRTIVQFCQEALGPRYRRQKELIPALAHEQIVRTYNVFQEGGNYNIFMECMAGGSLEERLREDSALPVDEAARIAAEVCAGLDRAHRRGIIHCDLKPANILFTSSGAARANPTRE